MIRKRPNALLTATWAHWPRFQSTASTRWRFAANACASAAARDRSAQAIGPGTYSTRATRVQNGDRRASASMAARLAFATRVRSPRAASEALFATSSSQFLLEASRLWGGHVSLVSRTLRRLWIRAYEKCPDDFGLFDTDSGQWDFWRFAGYHIAKTRRDWSPRFSWPCVGVRRAEAPTLQGKPPHLRPASRGTG